MMIMNLNRFLANLLLNSTLKRFSSSSSFSSVKRTKLLSLAAAPDYRHRLSSFSTTGRLQQQQQQQQKLSFEFYVSKFNDIHIKCKNIEQFFSELTKQLPTAEQRFAAFESTLKESLQKWHSEKRSSVWIYLPIELAQAGAIAAKYGFKYHHAEDGYAALFKWLQDDRECRIPRFATHQIGVAGLVYRSDTDQILVIKDKVMLKDVWKFPGGAADLGEDIQTTAMREVYEETGVRTQFKSIVAFRQQHNYPNAHGRSDLYVICRLEPLSFELNPCEREIKACGWVDLDYLCNYEQSKMAKRAARLIRHGKTHGFETIDICLNKMESIMPGRFFNFFHRNIGQLD